MEISASGIFGIGNVLTITGGIVWLFEEFNKLGAVETEVFPVAFNNGLISPFKNGVGLAILTGLVVDKMFSTLGDRVTIERPFCCVKALPVS